MNLKTKLLSVLLIICMITTLSNIVIFAADDFDGKTVVIYTGNLRGDIDILAQIADIKSQYEDKGANVILVDVGNYLQGTVYTTYDSGETMVKLMSDIGYDVVGIGSHEFDFGTGQVGVEQHTVLYQDGTLGKFLSDASFTAVSSNILTKDGGLNAYTLNVVIESIGFFGITDPMTTGQVISSNISGVTFEKAETIIEQQIAELADCDVIIGLSNVGGITNDDAVMIDISSEEGFTIGAYVIDDATNTVSEETITLSGSDSKIKSAIDEYKSLVDAEFPVSLVGKSNVKLNGSQKDVRSIETNLGNLWTDALLWFAVSGNIENYIEEDDIAAGNTEIIVDSDHIVALWNGGNLRDYLNTGDVTLKDLQRVLPYPNRVSVVYLTGSQLLEYLEATSQGLPFSSISNSVCASFMQVAGIKYTISPLLPYDSGEMYRPNWYKANSINRVTINSINGNDFSESDIYAVVTSNANYNGMDASYVCTEKGEESFISTAAVYDVVMMYILDELGGVIDETYAEPQGRITIDADSEHTYSDVSDSVWYSDYVNSVTVTGIMNGITFDEFAPETNITRGDFINLLYRMAGYPSVELIDIFTDIPADSMYARAAEWAAVKGITTGATETTFEPDEMLTQQQVATFIYRYYGMPEVSGELAYEGVEDWAVNAVIYYTANDLLSDVEFAAEAYVTRAMVAAILTNLK
jgi:5''-nucleotidase/2'',3''-cyclic phosphodiesterase and related esterases